LHSCSGHIFQKTFFAQFASVYPFFVGFLQAKMLLTNKLKIHPNMSLLVTTADEHIGSDMDYVVDATEEKANNSKVEVSSLDDSFSPATALVKAKTAKSDHKGDWQCYICGELRPEKSDIAGHIRANHYPKAKESMHGPPREFQCANCRVMFQTDGALGLHVCGEVPPSWTGGSRIRQCPQCEETFAKNYALLRHITLVHTKTRNFACDQCDYKAALPSLLKKHVDRVHKDRERTHLCNQCGSMFMEKTQLWAHISYTHGKTTEQCMCFHCGMIVKTDVGLMKHVMEKHGKDMNRTPSEDPSKLFKCETCAVEFSDLEIIRKHFRDEHKMVKDTPKCLPRYPCPECGKGTYNKPSLENHINRVHAKMKKYPCTRCPEAFYDSRNLKFHMDKHDGINQHECHVCAKKFKNRYLCDRHIKSVHDKSEVHVCHTCGFKTFHAYSLTAHIQQVHQKYRPNKCDYCEDAFFYKRDKEKHMIKAHGAKETW
jgi:KRAB domain-containing zinc finger protein